MKTIASLEPSQNCSFTTRKVALRNPHRVHRLWQGIALAGLCLARAHGASLAYEGFDYVPGSPLNALAGGTGFATPWTADPNVTIQATGLATPLGLPSMGLDAGGGFNSARQLSSALNQPEYWASFQIQANPGNDQVFLGFDVAPSATPLISFGRILNKYFIRQGSSAAVQNGIASPVGSTDLLVARFRQFGGVTQVHVWVNTLNFSLPPLLSLVVPTVPYTYVNLQVQPGLVADEIHIGTKPGDVSPSTLGSTVSGNQLILNWAKGTLLHSPSADGPWTTNTATSPYSVLMTEPQQFYRVILE